MHNVHMAKALELARANVAVGGRPFGAVLVRDGQAIAQAVNEIHLHGDPTAHAEMLAIRRASQELGKPRLEGCVIYASGHPCPMCLAAMYLCGVSAAYYAYSNEDAEPFGLSTAAVYAELAQVPEQSLPLQRLRPEGEEGLYAGWERRQG
jgi:tRNA(Arg) A34 adenosine deaminase TadA